MHADHGAEGLQIKPVEGGEIDGLEAGNWQDVVVPAGTKGAIVNTGALMARWTNDVWKATAHRVVVRSQEMASRERYSLTFFADPDVHSVIDVPNELLSKSGIKKKYEPITSDAYLLEKLRAMGRSPEQETFGEEKKE